jgi:HD-GYP domain-containing protein (c-di-GMP phosphodiesterase class II)
MVRETLTVAIDVLEADVGSMQMYDALTDSLIFRHVVDPNASVLIGLSVPASQGIDGRVFRTGISDLTHKASERSEWNDTVDERTGYHTESMLTVPVKRPDGDPIGVMQLLNGRRAFDQRDLEVLEVLCAQAAQAIANATLFEEAGRRLSHLQALRNIDMAITASLDLRVTLRVFLDQVAAQLKVDAASVLLLNQHTRTLEYASGHGFRTPAFQHTRLRLGESYAGRAALERRAISISDLSSSAGDMMRAPLLAAEEFVSYYAAPLVAKGQVKGVLEIFHRSTLDPNAEWLDFLEALTARAAVAVDNAELFNDLQRSNVELALAYDTTLEGWSCALDLRDKETEGHTQRVTEATMTLARAMNVAGAELVHMRRGALLHDIGKMGIPDSILLKPGPLTEEEWVIMRRHPMYAYELLSPIPFLRPALDIPYCHHEKWDGSGYPRGLRGEQIPLSARIFAIVDVWDALRSDRPYRGGWPLAKVREHIRQQSGTHFDPHVVEAFMQLDL